MNSDLKYINDLLSYIKNTGVFVEYLVDNKMEYRTTNEKEIKRIEKELAAIKRVLNKVNHKFNVRDYKKNGSKKNTLEYCKALISQGMGYKGVEILKSDLFLNNEEAYYLLGKTYYHGAFGIFGEKILDDASEAYYWFGLAYKKGNLEAGYSMGLIEQSKLNIQNAIKIYQTVANKGHVKSLIALKGIYKNDPKNKNEVKFKNTCDRIKKLESLVKNK